MQESFFGLGRRKEAVAQVYLRPATGKVICEIKTGRFGEYMVRDAKTYFKNDFLIKDLLFPLEITDNLQHYSVVAKVKGGGLTSQARAIKLGISRALLEAVPGIKVILKSKSLLTRDKRIKERKKIGKYGARRSPQFNKR